VDDSVLLAFSQHILWCSGFQLFWSRDPIRNYYISAWTQPLPATSKVFK